MFSLVQMIINPPEYKITIYNKRVEKKVERQKKSISHLSKENHTIDKMTTKTITEIYNYATSLGYVMQIDDSYDKIEEFTEYLMACYHYRDKGVLAIKPALQKLEFIYGVDCTEYIAEELPHLFEAWEEYDGDRDMIDYFWDNFSYECYDVDYDKIRFMIDLELVNDDAIILAYSEFLQDHDSEKLIKAVEDFVDCYGDDEYGTWCKENVHFDDDDE